MRKDIFILAAFLGLSSIALSYTALYSTTVDNTIVTGNGNLPTNLGEVSYGTNQNAALQVSRNGTLDGGGQGAALDIYAGPAQTDAYLMRMWVDAPTYIGGKIPVISVDYGGQMAMLTSLTISGQNASNTGTGQQALPRHPTTDSYMIGLWNDLNAGGTIYSAAAPWADAGGSNASVFIGMDGLSPSPNLRFSIDGPSGQLSWAASSSTTFAGTTWDAKFGRISAHILGDSATSLQTLHLDQPSASHDVDGTIQITAANNGSYTFGTAYTSAPVCVISPTAAPGGLTYFVTNTTTSVKVTLSGTATIQFNYHCAGNPN